MSTALLSILLMRLLAARRPDLRQSQQAAIVEKILRLPHDHVGVDGGAGDLRLSPEAQALIGSPAKRDPAPTAQPQAIDTAPDTSGPFFGGVFAAVEAAYPELPTLERVKLASKVVSSGGVGFAADKSLAFLPAARALAPKLPYSTNPDRDARARAYEAARSDSAPASTTPSTPTTPIAKPDDLATQLAAVSGNDDKAKTKRAALRAADLKRKIEQ